MLNRQSHFLANQNLIMKKLHLLGAAVCMAVSLNSYSQDSLNVEEQVIAYDLFADSIENTLSYKTGVIELENGVGSVTVPAGYKYLDAAQSEDVLVNLWGNPQYDDMTLGMLIPEDQRVMDEESFVFNLEYTPIGYVSDDDADDIDYDELLTDLQEEGQEDNKSRVEMGYEPIELVGWAAHPYYDKENKVLHWAKELKFGDNENHTLNYNIRVLGRKGVMVLNAIANMSELSLVEKDIPKILPSVAFTSGQRYADFDPDIDDVAAWTIGGLVAGKILTKVGFFAVLLKFWKFIAIGAVALFGGLWKRISGKKDEKQIQPAVAESVEKTDAE